MQHYNIHPILKNINLKIHSNKLITLIKPNNIKKNTLLTTITNVLSPQKNYIKINNVRHKSSIKNKQNIQKKNLLSTQPSLITNTTYHTQIHPKYKTHLQNKQ